MKSLQKSQSLSPEPIDRNDENGAQLEESSQEQRKMNGLANGKRSLSDTTVNQTPEAENSLSSNDVQTMLNKLRGLVHVPQDKQLSKLELMQCVIDYISELENSLHDGL